MRNNLPLVEKYEKILKQDKSSVVFAPLAEIYRKAGEFKKSLKVCESGLKHNPEYISGKIVLAHTHYELENFQKAKEVIEPYINKNPENNLLQKLWGKINLELGEDSLALDCFKRLLFLFPRDPELAELVENLELNVSPVMPEIEDDSGKKIDLKNWTHVNLKESIEIKKDNSTAIGFAKLFDKIGDTESVSQIINNIELEGEDKKQIFIEEVGAKEEKEANQNSLMDYFDLKLGDIDSLLEEEGSDHNIEPKLEKIDIHLEQRNKGEKRAAFNGAIIFSDELLAEVKQKCNIFLSLLTKRAEARA